MYNEVGRSSVTREEKYKWSERGDTTYVQDLLLTYPS